MRVIAHHHHHQYLLAQISACLAALLLPVLEITVPNLTVQYVPTTLTAKRAKLVRSRIAHREAVRQKPAPHGYPHPPVRIQTSARQAPSILPAELAAPRLKLLPALRTQVALPLTHAHRLPATDKAAKPFLALKRLRSSIHVKM